MTPKEKVEAVRMEALREKFRAAGAVEDLRQAVGQLQELMKKMDQAVSRREQ